MLGNLFNSFHSKKDNQEPKAKHSFLKKDNKKDKNKKVSSSCENIIHKKTIVLKSFFCQTNCSISFNH